MTSLNVIEDGKLVYTREQPFGGKQLTEEIMRRYGLSYEDAGRVKKEGGLPENYEPEVLYPFKQTMAQQVGRFLQFFYSSSEHEHVDYIALAGGCASIPGIAEMVESNLGIATGIANPFSNVKFAGRIAKQRINSDAPSLLITCGLALRGVM
jgi:type IV pilus assembly protein PilM